MFERFSRGARSAVNRAQQIAADEGSNTVEAQHLLLALSQGATDRTARALQRLSMTEVAIRKAISREFDQALQTVGAGSIAGSQGQPPPTSSRPRFGQSAKLALERTLKAALARGDRRLDDHHILLALAQAEAGVIPGLLKELNITPDAIATEIG